MAEDKYFYFKDVSLYASRRRLPYLMKWRKDLFSLEVEEEVDFRQRISLDIYKFYQKDSKPASTQYTKVVPVIKEVFLSHYTLAVKYIHETPIDDGEFYLYQHSKDWFDIYYFSRNEKDRRNIHIDFRDSIEDLWITVYATAGHKGRPSSRKNGEVITEERFRQFLNLTIQYFYDPDSVATLLGDYIKNFKLLCEGDTKIEGLIISVSKAFEDIFKQLDSRKEYLEKRLIENDGDSNIDRAKFRGELEGIGYAVKVININK